MAAVVPFHNMPSEWGPEKTLQHQRFDTDSLYRANVDMNKRYPMQSADWLGGRGTSKGQPRGSAGEKPASGVAVSKEEAKRAILQRMAGRR
jgi:hypothetical protein